VRSDITVTAQYTIVEPEVPPGGGEVTVWAFANLVLSVAGIILAIIAMVWVLLQQRQKQNKTPKNLQKNNENQNTTEQNDKQNEQQWQHRKVWLFAALVLGIAGIIVFLLTENLSLKMGLVDKWTIVNAILFIAGLIAITFVFKRKKR